MFLALFKLFSVESCWHILCDDRVSIWWSVDAKNTWFQASVRNLQNWPFFTYPTLTKRPAEIVLPGCERQQTLSYMTWEHIGTIKLIKNIIKSDIYSLFCQIWYKNEHFLKLKTILKTNIINFFFFSWIMLAHTLLWPCEYLMVIGCKKHLISSLCYKPVKLTFSPTPPSLKALLRSPCQAVNDNKWKHYLIWPENTLEPSNWLKML